MSVLRKIESVSKPVEGLGDEGLARDLEESADRSIQGAEQLHLKNYIEAEGLWSKGSLSRERFDELREATLRLHSDVYNRAFIEQLFAKLVTT